jgi:hypothetical protein
VLPTGSIVWRYRYRLNGKREKLTLGKYPALTLKNARLKRDEAAQAVALGQSPAQKKQLAKVAGPENVTVAEFAERFFRDIQERDRKDSTIPVATSTKTSSHTSAPSRSGRSPPKMSGPWSGGRSSRASMPPPARFAACSSAYSTTLSPVASWTTTP